MKNKSNLAKKLQLFYEEIEPKLQEESEKSRLQTDLEFQQNEIKGLNNKYNDETFSSKVRGGKAFAAEQKVGEFKKLLFKSNKLHKASKKGKVEPRKLIRNAVENKNRTNSQKYGLPPDEIESKSLASEKFPEIYDFYRMVKVSKDSVRYERSDILSDKKSRRKLRSPLSVAKKVFLLAERL